MIDDEVPLAMYAAVVAALGEGYALSVVLEHEGLSQDAWEAAEERWVERLGSSAEGDLSLFDALDRALAAGRARFARSVDPLDNDLDQFLAFKRHLAAAEKPIVMLAEHGLFLGDWVRLQERWAERLAADSALRAEAATRLSGSKAPPLPLVRPGPRALPPPLRPRPAAPIAVSPASSNSDELVEWGLSVLRDAPPIRGAQVRVMAESPRPLQPSAPAAPIVIVPPRAEAVLRAIPEGLSGDTTLPISPLEEVRAATRAPLPFKAASVSVDAVKSPIEPPSLTLEQYAQLCRELRKEPARVAEIRARYGLTDDATWAITRWRWQDRIHRDRDLRQRWTALVGPRPRRR